MVSATRRNTDRNSRDRRAAGSGMQVTVPVRLETRHGALDFSRRTLIMGVLNITPDSFYDGGRHLGREGAVADAIAMAAEGADIIDIGGESTRPGAQPVSETEELDRVLPVIEGIRRNCSVPISIDTYKSAVARAGLAAGADIINDISALRFDLEMAPLAAQEEVPIVLMHMQGTPQTMQHEPSYENVVQEVREFLAERVAFAESSGVAPERVIIDPGIGFGKTMEHNLCLLRELHEFTQLGQPLLVGASRKRFIGRILDADADARLEGSLAAAVAAALAGANILRVHDVKETWRAVRVANAIRFGAEV